MAPVKFIAALAAALVVAQDATAAWNAGPDLTANERPNGPQELGNPNPTVPEWSYGYRYTVAGTALTPIPNHFNDGGGYPSFDGWNLPGTALTAGVNAGSSPIVFNNGPGPLVPLQPQVMVLHPGGDGSLSVVRWTAPFGGFFTINAHWSDIDPYGGGGADGHVVINGTSFYDAYWPNGGSATAPPLSLGLNPGDIVDFALGPNGDYGFDSTAFSATITGTPEPSSVFAFVASVAAIMFGAKRFLNEQHTCQAVGEA